MNLWEQPLHKLDELLAEKQCSVSEIARAFSERIDAVDDELRSVLHRVDSEQLIARAEQARSVSDDSDNPLAGMPFGLSDNIVTSEAPTTAASRMLSDYVSPFTATAVVRLQEKRATLAGKLNLDEFGIGTTTESSAYQTTVNPWDVQRVPGGASGGAAAAVAAGLVAFALGSDSGGGVRQPAAYCGVVGLKPTYGHVSRYGLIATASSMDQIGTLTRDVTDAAIVLQAIAGQDPYDNTSSPTDVPNYRAALAEGVRGMKIGLPEQFFTDRVDPEVKAAVLAAAEALRGLGADVTECSLPHVEYALGTYHMISAAESSSNLSRYDGVRFGYRAEANDYVTMYKKTRAEGFGTLVKQRILLGTHMLTKDQYVAHMKKAQQVRTLIRDEFTNAFARFDLLLTPTTPTVAFPLGMSSDDPNVSMNSELFTVAAGLAGLPAISVPCGFQDNLPIGLQLIGKPFAEADLLRAAYAVEQDLGVHHRRPPLGRDGSEGSN